MEKMPEDIMIGQHLTTSGAITEDQLNEALEIQKDLGGRLGRILVKLGYVTEESLVTHLARQMELKLVKLSDVKIPPALLRMIPQSTIRNKKVLPLSLVDGTLEVAMAYPHDLETLEEIQFETGENVVAVIASEREIDRAIANCLGPSPADTEEGTEPFPEEPPRPPAKEDVPLPSPQAIREAVEAAEAREARDSLLRFPTRVKIDALIEALLDAGVIDEATLAQMLKERLKSE